MLPVKANSGAGGLAMLWRNLMLCIAALVVTGCASTFAPTPPSVPSPTDVQARALELKKVANGDDGDNTVDPATYERVGLSLTDESCELYFDSLTRTSNDTEFNKAEASQAGAAAAAIMTLTKVTQKAIGITALGFGLVNQTFQNYEQYELFQAYPDDVHSLVRKAMADYRSAASKSPADIYAADGIVSAYAMLCTRTGINHLAHLAISTATTGAGPPASNVVFSADDQTVLTLVNSDLGVSSLSNDQYAMLEILADGGAQNDLLLNGILLQFTADFRSKIYDSVNKKLTGAMVTAGARLISLAKTNASFAARIKAIRDKNTPSSTPVGRTVPAFQQGTFALPPAEAAPPSVTVNGVVS